MNRNTLEMIKRLNKTIVHSDGTIDSFERQLLNLSGGIFDVTKPLILSENSISLNYFEKNTNKIITMRANTAIKIREKHEIGYAFVGKTLDLLKESVLAFESLTQTNSKVVLLDCLNEENNPYIAICRTDKVMNMINVNEITSIYDKTNFENFLIKTFNENKQFYKNKKTEHYIKSQRLQLPREIIYALSNDYNRTSFTKSQVERDIFKELYSQCIDEQNPMKLKQNLTASILDKLSYSEDWITRTQVAKHPNVSTITLHKLLIDSNETVKNVASNHLEAMELDEIEGNKYEMEL